MIPGWIDSLQHAQRTVPVATLDGRGRQGRHAARPRPARRPWKLHEPAGLTLDRYGHLYESDVAAVGVAINSLLTRDCGADTHLTSEINLWSLGESNP
jgi:hypothetical protein